jgi:hypothetical protein
MQKVGGLPTLNGGSDVENDFRDIDGCFRRCDSDLGPRECVFSSPRFPALPKGVQIYLSQPFPQHFVTRLAIALLRDLADRDDLEEFAVGLDTLALDEPEELRPVGAELFVQVAKAKRIEICLVDSLDRDDCGISVAILDQPDGLALVASDPKGQAGAVAVRLDCECGYLGKNRPRVFALVDPVYDTI